MNSKPTGHFLLVLPWEPHHHGGVTGVVQNLLKVIKSDTLQALLAINTWEVRYPQYGNDGVWRLRMPALATEDSRKIAKSLLMAPCGLLRLRLFIKKMNIRAINFHYPGSAPIGIAVLKALGLYDGALILSFHGTDVHEPSGWLERHLTKFILNASDALVACSESLALRMAKTFELPSNRITVIHNGVDSVRFRPDCPAPPSFAGPQPESYIISNGAYIPRKDHLTVVRAFAVVAVTHPKLELVIVGASGPDHERITKLAGELGLASRIHALCSVEQAGVAYLLSRATLCVQAALAESFPLALLEAAAANTPAIVSRIPGHTELVLDGVTGNSFATGDVQGCAAAIDEALSHPERTHAMAATLRSKVVSEFTWEACADAYLRLVRDPR